MTNDRCLSTEELEEVRLSQPDGPRRLHIEACAQCAARLAAYEEFLTLEGEPQSSREQDAMTRLGSFLEGTFLHPAHRLAGSMRMESPGSGGRLPLRWLAMLLVPRRLVPIVCGALALLVVTWLWHPWERGAPAPLQLRGTDRAAALQTEPAVTGANGELALRWHAVAGAQSYLVILLSAGFREVGRYEAGSDTALALGPDRLPQTSADGFRGFWQVRALAARGEIARSRPAPLLPSAR